MQQYQKQLLGMFDEINNCFEINKDIVENYPELRRLVQKFQELYLEILKSSEEKLKKPDLKIFQIRPGQIFN